MLKVSMLRTSERLTGLRKLGAEQEMRVEIEVHRTLGAGFTYFGFEAESH